MAAAPQPGAAPSALTTGQAPVANPVQSTPQTPPAGSPPPGEAAAPAPWFASIESPELRGYTENKAWKTPADAVHAYRELEKLHGAPADQLLRLPGKDAKPEEWAAFYEKLGRPKTADEYKLVGLDGTGTDPLAQRLGPAMHQLNLTAAQAKGLNEAYLAVVNEAQQAQVQARLDQLDAEKTQLHQEWPGETFNQNLEAGRRAVRSYGLSEDFLAQFESQVGYRAMMKFFFEVGARQGEGPYIEGNSNTRNNNFSGRSPEAARAEIARLSSNAEFRKKWLVDGDKAAAEQINNLQIIATQDRINQVR
jgi:hypothetical protein